MHRNHRTHLIVALLGALLVLAACGGDADEPAATPSPTAVAQTPEATPSPNAVELQTVSTPATVAEEASPESVAQTPASTPAGITDGPELVVAEPSDSDESFAKPTPPGGVYPTVPPNPKSSFDSDGDGLYTQDEMNEAIEYRFGEYEWPPNFSVTPGDVTSVLNLPPGSLIEAPGEYTILGRFHTCSWEVTLLNATLAGDQELIDESMYQLVEFGQKKNPLSRDENGKAHYRDLYNKAILGDPSGLQNGINSNCEFVLPPFDDAEAVAPPPIWRLIAQTGSR